MSDTPYQSLERLRARIEYEPSDLFDDRDNAEKRFDRLLMGTDAVDGAPTPSWGGLEREARALIETRTGDETYALEEGRTDDIRATDDAAIKLPWPVQDVTEVEVKRHLGSDFDTLADRRWDHTDRRLVLAERGHKRGRFPYVERSRNELTANTTRQTWRDLAARVRVTYDRGFETVPYDVLTVQTTLVNLMLRNLKTEQNIAAMEPDQIEAVVNAEAIITDDVERQIGALTKPGGVAGSV